MNNILPSSDPNKGQNIQNISELALLIQLMGSINSGVETMKALLQTTNTTNGLIIEQLLSIRQELKVWQKDTLETRALRSDIDIKSLEAKDKEYEAELKKIQDAQSEVKTALETMKNGRGQTQEKITAIVKDAISADKVDIRGVKISSRQFTYVLIGLVVLLALAIIFLPEAVSQILIRIAGAVTPGTP